VKDQMTARNLVLSNDKPANYPDADFLPIYTGMRALLPACDLIATAGAANNQAYIMDVEEVVVDLIKDCVKKLEDTKRRTNGVLVNPWLVPAQMTLDSTVLPLGAPVLWGSATDIPNLGQLPQSLPVAIIRGAPHPPAQQDNLAPPPHVVGASQGNSGASGSVLSQAVNIAPLAQSSRLNRAVLVPLEVSYLKLSTLF